MTPTTINQADTAWMLVATALVLVMTPALGFFYGGLVRAKNTLNTMMMSYVALGFVGIAWAFIGYTFAFSTGGNWLGGLDNAFFRGVGLDAKGTIPHVLFAGYQATFCVITAALISGAIVERMRWPIRRRHHRLADRGLCAYRALGVRRGLARQARRSRLRGRHRRSYQCCRRRTGGRGGARRAERLRADGNHSAERPFHAAWRRPALVRVVRLQRR